MSDLSRQFSSQDQESFEEYYLPTKSPSRRDFEEEKLIRTQGNFAFYPMIGKASKSGVLWLLAFMGFFVVLSMLLWVSFNWTAIDGVEVYPLGAVKDSSGEVKVHCPEGMEHHNLWGCVVKLDRSSPISEVIMNQTQNPCESPARYLSGAWALSNQNSASPSLFFGSAMAAGEGRMRALMDQEASGVSAESRSSSQYHPFTMSCVYTAQHPESSGDDVAFINGTLNSLLPESELGNSAVFQVGYVLGASIGHGMEPIFALHDTVDPTKSDNSLLEWGVGNFIMMFPVAKEEKLREFFEDSCRALMYLKHFPQSLYLGPAECAEDQIRLLKRFVRSAALTEASEHPMNAEYIMGYMEQHDLYTPEGLGQALNEATGVDFVSGILKAVQVELSSYRGFLNQYGLDAPGVFQLGQWVRRVAYLQEVYTIMEEETPLRIITFVKLHTMQHAMQFTPAVLNAYEPNGEPEFNGDRNILGRLIQIGRDSERLLLEANSGVSPLHWVQQSKSTASRRMQYATGAIGHPLQVFEQPLGKTRTAQLHPLVNFLRVEKAVAKAVSDASDAAKRGSDSHLDAASSSVYERDHVDDMTEVMSSALWEECNWLAQQYLPEYVARRYVDTMVEESTLQEVRSMAEGIRQKLIERIEQTKLSVPLKNQLISKLRSMQLVLGAPTKEQAAPQLPQPSMDGSLLQNQMRLQRSNYMQGVFEALHFKGTPNALRRNAKLAMPTSYPNVYYTPWENRLYVLAGVMTPPLYFDGWSDAAKHAMLGATIGHEMSHAVDAEGSQFNKDGNMVVQRGEVGTRDFNYFKALLECLAETQELHTTGVHNNTVQTSRSINEIAADTLGLQLAYDALKQKHNGELSKEQKAEFLFAYVQMHASSISKTQEAQSCATDVHPPAAVRQDGPLRHLRDSEECLVVQSVFGCPTGSGMVYYEQVCT